MTATIHALPDDVLDHVARFLVYERHFAALACTSHRFNGVAKRAIHPTAQLLRACRRGRAGDVARLLRDRRAEPTARNHYALRAAAEFGHAVVVDLLLHDGRADPAAINMGTITHTNLNGHGNILRLILKHPTLANRVAIARSTWCQRSARARACVLRGPELDFGAFVDAADSPIARGDQVGRLFVNRSFFFLGLLLQQTSIDAYGRRRN